jgi:2-(1,2-epoxy-1,2-dihydrophenyl)acetyl-CoA isomerase
VSYETLNWEQEGGAVTVTLNRPELFNAFNETMAAELLDVIDRIATDQSVRAALFTGAGKAFLAGQDLREVEDLRAAGTFREYLERSWNPVVSGIWNLAKPTVAAVNGPAVGAGVGFALACDLVLASERASFIIPFSQLGFIPDAGLTWLLPRLVGMGRALELVYLAEPFDALRAEQLGLVNEVTSPDKLAGRAREIVGRLAQGPTVALGAAKQAMHAATAISYDEALASEAVIQDVAGRTADNREGVAAFLEKRSPTFGGR